MAKCGGHGGRANSSSSLNPFDPQPASESYDLAYLLTMENYNDSDDSSFEDLNRTCRHARKFIDGSIAFFFNEDDEENEKQHHSDEDSSPRTREDKWIHQRLVWSSHL